MSTDLPRSIVLVALAIYENIPNDKKEFKQAVHDFIHKDLPYRSPEMLLHPNTWNIFQTTIMYKHIPEPIEPWEKKVVDIYIGNLEFNVNTSD
jgi:hypothetical protein